MKTFAMIKPDAVRTHCIGQVLSRIELSTSVRVIEMRMVLLDEQQARQFYGEHEGKPFFEPLVQFTTSGPLVAMVLSGDDVVQWWREVMGDTDPQKARPGTLRAQLGMGMPNNAVHGSDSPESAEREIALFRTWV